MPWSGSAPNMQFTRGSGVYSGATTWQQTDAAARGIRADDHDTHDEDIADGLDLAARKDGGNIGTAWSPATNNASALGTGSLKWADLFLASGAVINFNNGDVTITHSANSIAFAGGSSGYTFDAIIHPAVSDGASLGNGSVMWSDLFLALGGVINWNNGGHTITPSGGSILVAGSAFADIRVAGAIIPTTNDAGALGSGTLKWADLFLADGGVINWNNGAITVQNSGTALLFAGASGGYRFDADLLKNDVAYTNPDYVFEHFYEGKIDRFKDNDGAKDYRGLIALDDLRDYTKNNFRLPGISDEEMGIFARGDIALEKTEELTLYILQLHDRIRELEVVGK